jgi:hypothetical protein
VGKVHAKDNVVRGAPKGRTPGWRKPIRQEGTKETRNRDFENQLRLGSKREFKKTLRKAKGLEIIKKIAGFPVHCKEVSTGY